MVKSNKKSYFQNRLLSIEIVLNVTLFIMNESVKPEDINKTLFLR